MDKKLYNKLFKQSIKESLPQIGTGIYNALPNHMGACLERFTELCQINSICARCGESIKNCICNELEN